MGIHNNKPLVSIIVPVFNAEKWISACIKSLVGQSYKNLEIILVDDGSADHSEMICRQYAEQDERIVYIRKINTGVSAARNTGLESAQGDFVCFVDADDYLDRDVIKIAVEEMVKKKNLLIQWNVVFVDEKNAYPQQSIFVDEISLEEFRYNIICGYRGKFDLGSYARAVWGKLFITNIIKEHNLRFQTDIYMGEDALFLMKYSNYIEEMSVVNYYGYYYRQIQTSATGRHKKDLLHQSRNQLLAMRKIHAKWFEKDKYFEDSLALYAVLVVHALIDNGNKINADIEVSFREKYQDAYNWIDENKALIRKKTTLPIAGKLLKIEKAVLSFLPGKIACLMIDFIISAKSIRS